MFVAPRGPASGVLDVLQDLSAAGLLQPFLWVDAAAIEGLGTGRSELGALEVRGGRQMGTTVQTVLSNNRFQRLRVCVLVPLLGDASSVSSAAEQQVAELVSSSSGASGLTRIRCAFTRPNSGAGTGVAARDGWHNIVVAPEDAQGPGFGHTLLPPSADPVDIGRHVAPVVASLAGLWAAVDHAPLDDEPVLPGDTVRVARSFYRGLDAASVEHELRTRFLSTEHGLPLPRLQGASVIYIDDVALAGRSMSNALWTTHSAVLKGPRVRAESAPPTPLTIGMALHMLFGFIGAAIKNAPAQWYSAAVGKVSSSVASAVQGLVFGSAPSAYSVVTSGVTEQGTPVDWRQLSAASEQISDLLLDPGEARTHQSRADLSAVWRDYAAGALTLCDGGARSPNMPAVQIGPDRGVLRSGADCVPPSTERFAELPGHLAAAVGVPSVQATDVLGIYALEQRLQHSQRDPALALDAGRAGQALAEWKSRHQRSYAVQVGTVIGSYLYGTRQEVESLLQELRAAATPVQPSSEAAARQRLLATLIKVFFGVYVVTVAAASVLFFNTTWTAISGLSLKFYLWTIGIATLLWIVATLITFIQGQRELFAELNRRRDAMAAAEAAKTNLRQALKDLCRLGDAYGQYLSWSQALGAVLDSPLGAAPPPLAGSVRIAGGLPRGTQLGVAEPREQLVADAAGTLRQDMFTVGWLTRPWDSAIGAAGMRLGQHGQELRDNPSALLSMPGAGPRFSPLQAWADLLVTEGTGVEIGGELWAMAHRALQGPRAGLATQLLSAVRSTGTQTHEVMDLPTFMSGVDQPAQPEHQQRFDDALFTPQARTAGRSRVDRSAGNQSRRGLSTAAVLTQLTEGLPCYDLGLTETAQAVGADNSPTAVQAQEPVLPPEPPPGSGTLVF